MSAAVSSSWTSTNAFSISAQTACTMRLRGLCYLLLSTIARGIWLRAAGPRWSDQTKDKAKVRARAGISVNSDKDNDISKHQDLPYNIRRCSGCPTTTPTIELDLQSTRLVRRAANYSMLEGRERILCRACSHLAVCRVRPIKHGRSMQCT